MPTWNRLEISLVFIECRGRPCFHGQCKHAMGSFPLTTMVRLSSWSQLRGCQHVPTIRIGHGAEQTRDGCEVPGPMLALWLSRRFGKFWQNHLQMEKWDAEMLLKHVETMYQMYQARPSFVSVGRFILWTRTRHVGFWIRIHGAVGVVGCWWLVTGPGDHGSLDQRRHCDSGLRRPWPQTAGTEQKKPEARHEIRGESSCINRCISLVFSGISRYVSVCFAPAWSC